MKRCLAAVMGCALLLLGACADGGAQPQTPPPGAYKIYYAVSSWEYSDAAIDCEYHTLPENSPPVPALMRLLLDPPTEQGLRSPYPEGVRLLSWDIEDGQLQLDLSEQYGGLSGVSLTVADYCIALTLCQVEGVDSVSITVEGRELSLRQTQQLRGGDVLFPGAEETIVQEAVLWFPRAGENELGAERREIVKTEDDTLRGVVLSAWLAGPNRQDFIRCAPAGTVIRSVTQENKICVIDLSRQFQTGAPEDPERARLALYALANTMCSLDGVEGIRLLIEGEPVSSYGGFAADWPLVPDSAPEKN